MRPFQGRESAIVGTWGLRPQANICDLFEVGSRMHPGALLRGIRDLFEVGLPSRLERRIHSAPDFSIPEG